MTIRLVMMLTAGMLLGGSACTRKKRPTEPVTPPAPAAAASTLPPPAPKSKPATAAFDLSELKTLWALPFPKPQLDSRGQDLIRVRIYPHPFKTADKRGAEPLDKVSLNGACDVWEAKPDKVQRGGRKIGSGKSHTFSLKDLGRPRWLECTGETVVERRPPLIAHRYAGNFYIYKASGTAISPAPYVSVILVTPIETYLRGVVPSEVIPSWPEETLKAQAVAARTYAYFNMAHNQFFPNPKIYDVDDTNHYQAFSGLTNITPQTDAAIGATRGETLSFAKKIIPAFFDTDSGGHTEDGFTVFGLPTPYCKAKSERPEIVQTVKPWTMELSSALLAQGLATHVPKGKKIASLSLPGGATTPGRRPRKIRLHFDNGSHKDVEMEVFRSAVPGIKSALFTVRESNTAKTILEGRGIGHGVGLNQMGAKVLAAQLKWDYRRILGFYFDNTRLCALSAKPGISRCT